MAVAVGEIGNLSKPRRQRQRQQQRRETKGLMSRTIAVHVRFESLYISLPFSAKQQREMTKFCVCWRTYATSANILDFVMKLIAGYSGPRGFLLFFIGKFCDANRFLYIFFIGSALRSALRVANFQMKKDKAIPIKYFVSHRPADPFFWKRTKKKYSESLVKK